MTYKLDNGGSESSEIKSPVVEKDGGYDTGLLGKNGVIETAYHTIKWTLAVNQNSETLTGVTVADKLTYAAPVTAAPKKYQLCNHVYDDSEVRNRPQYTYDNQTFYDFTTYDAATPDKAFTYRLIPDANGKVYDMVLYLGDLSEQVFIVYRSTATDEIIYANNIASNNCGYENKATLTTADNAFSYASADVVYKSNVYAKAATPSWFNRQQDSYLYDENQFPWQMVVNVNQMEMKDICISDTLSEGTSLVPGTMFIGGNIAWYKLHDAADTVAIPEYSEGMQKPYYTYDDETRELKIYLNDITGSKVGTADAIRKIIFYVQVDVEHPIFTDAEYSGYLGNATGTVWKIPNTAYLSDNYLSGADAVKSATSYSVLVQHLSKKGAAYKNGNAYSIDYSLAVNRIQQPLPETAIITDNIPAGLRLDASTVKLYEATVISPDMFHVLDDGTIGTMVKGTEIDRSLYSVETAVNNDGTTTMHLTLPKNSGTKMYIVEYSCDVTDVSKVPFTNSALIEGVKDSGVEQTITKIQLNAASGGGTMLGAEKTDVYVNKTDSVSGAPVQGAVFGVYYKGVLIEKKETDAQGKITFENLNKGMTYTVTELSTAPGYLDPVNMTDTFAAAAKDDPTILFFENTPKVGTVQFVKTDDNNAALPGAQFGVWANTADISVSEPLATATSSSRGLVVFANLAAGKIYYISEIFAPTGFQKSDEVIVAKMNMNGELEKLWCQSDTTQVAITSFANSPVPPIIYTTLSVTKEWNDFDSASRPASVSVQLYRDGEAYKEAVTLNKDNDWTATWSDLDGRYDWTVDELNVPDGYTKNVSHSGTQWTITNNMIGAAMVELTGNKTLDGQKKTEDIADGEFTFRVVTVEENNTSGFIGLNSSVSVKAGGAIDFGTLTFTRAGTYRFIISENDLGKTGYTYDKSTYGVEVVVTLNENTNELQAVTTITKDGEAADAIVFANSYTEPSDPDKPSEPDIPTEPDKPSNPDTPTKPDKPSNPDKPASPQTGDSSNMVLWIVLAVLSAGGIFAVSLNGKRKKLRHEKTHK